MIKEEGILCGLSGGKLQVWSKLSLNLKNKKFLNFLSKIIIIPLLELLNLVQS